MNNTKVIIIISLVLLIMATTVYGLREVIVLNLEFSKNGSVKLIDLYLGEGEESVEMSETGDYRIEVLAEGNKVLYAKYYTPNFELHIDAPQGGEELPKGIISVEKTNALLKIPYFENAKSVRLHYKNNVVLEKELVFCNNNGLCEPSKKESLLSCPSDCKSGTADNYCDSILDGVCDEDCVSQGRREKDVDCTCGNKVCDERETEKLCPQDCKIKMLFWQRVWNFIKSIFT